MLGPAAEGSLSGERPDLGGSLTCGQQCRQQRGSSRHSKASL